MEFTLWVCNILHGLIWRRWGSAHGTMVWERPILRKKYYLLWKCSEIARNVLWRSNLIVFYLVHISRGLYTDWSISLYVITFWPELMRIWEKGPHSMIDFFQIFLIKNGSHFLIEYFVFSLYNVFKVKKKLMNSLILRIKN